MSKRSPIALDVKLRIVKRCIQNESNPSYEAKQLGVRTSINDHRSTLYSSVNV